MCVTLMLSSLITTLYVQRQWLATKISKVVKSFLPARPTTLVCTEREPLEGRETLDTIAEEKEGSNNGVTVTEVVDDSDKSEKYNAEPFCTRPSMEDMTITNENLLCNSEVNSLWIKSF
ncbi:hypothetical protein GE061_010934 [Apolygus lucorum]|uniref:Uncharacterized protein n=1 Tax=Apolygus lucorum TaxID=248454 RepID=A0A6A4K6W6_APOLU|nr:hypothetical protein GE061_010934 [Apolygus lucorum]